MELDAIIDALKAQIMQIAPHVRFVPKYGGQVLCPIEGDNKSSVGGLFSYKDHVSLEFSNGANLDDPERCLEGSGKLRRHLKFKRLSDIDSKKPEQFLKQIL